MTTQFQPFMGYCRVVSSQEKDTHHYALDACENQRKPLDLFSRSLPCCPRVEGARSSDLRTLVFAGQRLKICPSGSRGSTRCSPVEKGESAESCVRARMVAGNT